jgi:lambda repressor-like predicted transcriptional regulator
LSLTDRGISVEKLLKLSGLTQSSLKERHTEKYFKNNLAIGQQEKTYYFSRNGS